MNEPPFTPPSLDDPMAATIAAHRNADASSDAPYLPQNGNILQRTERAGQLALFRLVYEFEHWDGLPMPMASQGAAIASLPSLGTWLKGQAGNLAFIALNLEIWKVLRRFDSTTDTLSDGVAQLSTALQSAEIHERLKQEVAQKDGSFSAGEDLVERIETLLKEGSDKDEAAQRLDSTADYAKASPLYPMADIVQYWQDDRIFASQRLAGLNPMIIERVTTDGVVGTYWKQLAGKLAPSMDSRVVSQFLPGYTLERAVAEHRLFVADYVALSKITADADAAGVFASKRPLAPIALYVRTDTFPGLTLAAIQLDQGIATQPPSILAIEAKDGTKANNWTLAKLFVQAADLSYNQAVNHLGMTHLLEEAFALTTHRRLAKQHPLNVLFSRHFAALFMINQLGKLTLLKSGPQGLINLLLETGLGGEDGKPIGATGLISDAYAKWQFSDLDFADNIRSRGLEDEALPYFPYRDDGKLIWDTLGDYARDYVQLYYKCTDDVTGDYELQAWANELRSRGNIKSLPVLDSVEAVIGVVQRLLWTAGPQHASVNFPQVAYTTFVPGYPAAPYAEPPTAKTFATTSMTRKRVLDTLAPLSNTTVQVQVSYTLAGYHYDQLLDYYAALSPAAAAVCKTHYETLTQQVAPEIVRRNIARQSRAGLLDYPYFLPQNIPNSTSV